MLNGCLRWLAPIGYSRESPDRHQRGEYCTRAYQWEWWGEGRAFLWHTHPLLYEYWYCTQITDLKGRKSEREHGAVSNVCDLSGHGHHDMSLTCKCAWVE